MARGERAKAIASTQLNWLPIHVITGKPKLRMRTKPLGSKYNRKRRKKVIEQCSPTHLNRTEPTKREGRPYEKNWRKMVVTKNGRKKKRPCQRKTRHGR